jgi:hypothetical protein
MYNASFLNLYLVPHGVIRAYVIAAAFRERCVCTNKLKYTTRQNPPNTRAAGDAQEEWANPQNVYFFFRRPFFTTRTSGAASTRAASSPAALVKVEPG